MSISVIIPVFHEASLVNEAIARLENVECDRPVEIIVVDGSTEGETLKAIGNGRARGIISGKGRGKQMNTGAAAATGEIVLFLHVDTRLPDGAFEEISRTMQTGRFVGGAFNLGIGDGAFAFRLIERVASLRSRLTRIPYGDQALFFGRRYFMEIGGYKEVPIMEDVDLMRRVKKNGGRICFIEKRVYTSARRWKQEGIIACTVRNWIIMLLYLVGVPPAKLVRWYL